MRLTDCFMDLVAYVAYFLKAVDTQQPGFDQVKADIQRLMNESEQCMQTGGFSADDFDNARFAICAWIDEAILNSAWQQRSKWQLELLQRVYYQTTDAGEIFFDRLNSLGPHQRDVREVYYLCLAMGFIGRYCNQGDEYLLEQLKTSNLKVLTGSSAGIPSLERTELFPEGYPMGEVDAGAGRRSSWFSGFNLLCLAVPVGLFVVLFVVYTFILNSVGEGILAG